MKKLFAFGAACMIFAAHSLLQAQDTATYRLRLQAPLLDLPQNASLPFRYPSMVQAMEFSNDFYELANWGIDGLGDKLFIPKDKQPSKFRRVANHAFKYATSLAFSKYGSELPIPLGVWGHEEFHRSVLGVNGIHAENGNWLLSRWDGTVYGVSDQEMADLKQQNPDELLYSYVSGVQYEVALNEKTTLGDFYKRRSLPKNALLLYNAYYMYNYFNFSTGPFSDSVKVIAPQFESKDPSQRDFAGADLTAWVYDMYAPTAAYTDRDSFPDGDGVNRRVGFSDLSPAGQEFLEKQKTLSLINFLNPAIFFVNRIRINDEFAFNAFAQYAPTHFGNDIAVMVPVSVKHHDLLLGIHRYSGEQEAGLGMTLGLFNHAFGEKLNADMQVQVWNQPRSFFGNDKVLGGKLEMKARYPIKGGLSATAAVQAKTKGWSLGNPYLASNVSGQVGLDFNLKKQ